MKLYVYLPLCSETSFRLLYRRHSYSRGPQKKRGLPFPCDENSLREGPQPPLGQPNRARTMLFFVPDEVKSERFLPTSHLKQRKTIFTFLERL